MSEPLLTEGTTNSNLAEESNIKEDPLHSSEFDFDIVEDTLLHLYSRSKLRRFLAYILAKLYKYPTLIIIFSFLLGFLFFGIPLLLMYIKIFSNLILPIIIMFTITWILLVLNLLVRTIDDTKNKIAISAKWERKNIVTNTGFIFSFLLLGISMIIFYIFCENVLDYNNNNKLKIIYEPEEKDIDDKDKIEINDFFLKFMINCFLLNENQIKNEETKVTNYIDDYSILKELIQNLCKCFIPLLILCFNKSIQTIILKVKFTIPKLIFFPSCFGFCILYIVVKYKFKEEEENSLLSFFEIVFITLIFFGYLSWCFSSIWRIFKNPKDKNFSIHRYYLKQLIFIYIFAFINIIGISFIFISILMNYINYNNKNETFNDLKLVLMLLKIGFFFFIISNSFYYGHGALSLLLRPIALQYAPCKLKENYIKAVRNLSTSTYIFM
jgi:hypothetical protein